MKYDDASWHYEGDFPKELPTEAGATHIGMFLSWMLLNGMASEELLEDAADEIAALQARTITGSEFLIKVLGEKLTDEEFHQTGNAFAVAYYLGKDDDSRYFDDYLQVFDAEETLYHVQDSWEHYDRLSGLIDGRYAVWNAQGRPEFLL